MTHDEEIAAILDPHFPPCGPCAFCGFRDKRHRLWDMWIGLSKHETPETIAWAYHYPVEAVLAVISVQPYQEDRERL